MTKQEIELFQSLCGFKTEKFDESLLRYASPNVLGHLFYNRMQGAAYGVLKKHGLTEKVNREFKNSLKGAYEQNKEKNKSFFEAVEYVSDILKKTDCKFAMLKGALLCKLYPKGYRTSNDIDLMVMPEHVTKIGNLLISEGFRQGKICNEKFIPAGRREIIESKMTRGETIPYIKEIGLPGMRYLEVDINFSIDYKSGSDDILQKILDRTRCVYLDDMQIQTLDGIDFFIHLCGHLYKEATTLPWIEMRRDMTLYKYCDIYFLLYKADRQTIIRLFRRAEELGMDKICGCVIKQTSELFDIDNAYAVKIAEKALETDPDFTLRVVAPKEKKIFQYKTPNAGQRFFMDNRMSDLKEVNFK